MEIHQLRYFVAVAEEGSFSHAAEREHVSQPSLSQQIQKLEAELNQQLFDRLPRAVVLTEAGRCLLPYARQVLTAIADAGRSVAALEDEVAGRLSVGAIPSIALYVLPRLIVSFQRSYPKVTFELFEDTTDKLAQRLEGGSLDVVLASSGDETPTLAQHSLGKEPLLMLLPEKHRLARKKTIKWSDLASEKFLLLHEVHSLSITVRQLLAAAPDVFTGMSGVLIVGGVSLTVTRCASVVWVNKRTTSDVRATVHSFLSQAEYLGEITLGLGLGALAQATSIAAAMLGACGLVALTGVMVVRARRARA
jgi:LysR family hydrogen peroxide-inducible transcriptional activator